MSEKMIKVPAWFFKILCEYFARGDRSEINEELIKSYLEEKLTAMTKRIEYRKKKIHKD